MSRRGAAWWRFEQRPIALSVEPRRADRNGDFRSSRAPRCPALLNKPLFAAGGGLRMEAEHYDHSLALQQSVLMCFDVHIPASDVVPASIAPGLVAERDESASALGRESEDLWKCRGL